MDPTLQAKIDEAKANGYTDEEISAYLGNQDKPLIQNPPMDRSEEYAGLTEGALGKAALTGIELYGAKKLLLDPLIGAYKSRGGPVSPSQMAQAAQNVGQAAQASQAGQVAQNVGQAARATGTGGAGAFNQMANQLGQAGVPRTITGANGQVLSVAPTGEAPATRAPGMMQRGMDIANQMRQYAAQRVIPAGAVAGPAAVMGGVAAVPGAMMYDAYKNYQGQSPEDRKRSAMEALSGQGLGQAGIY